MSLKLTDADIATFLLAQNFPMASQSNCTNFRTAQYKAEI